MKEDIFAPKVTFATTYGYKVPTCRKKVVFEIRKPFLRHPSALLGTMFFENH